MTGQHLEMADNLLKLFEIKEDLNLRLMKSNQTLTHITTEVIKGLKNEFSNYLPRLVLFRVILVPHSQLLWLRFLKRYL